MCIEVKHVETIGKPFILTMNEEVVARKKRSEYALAIVAQSVAGVSLVLFSDPIRACILSANAVNGYGSARHIRPTPNFIHSGSKQKRWQM